MATDTEIKKKFYESHYELKDNAEVLLKVTIPKEEVQNEYNTLVTKYCKSVQIKGFRKGKVPPDVLKRKFGESIQAESTQNLIEKVLDHAFEESKHKPLPYAEPQLNEKSEFDLEKDFTFEITFDSYPEITLGTYKNLEIQKIVPDITDKDLESELKAIQDQNAIVQEKADGIIEKENIVSIDYVELDDDGNEIAKTRREAFSFTVGSGYNLHKIDDDIVGMKKDEEKVLEKSYPEDFEYKDLAGKTIHLKVNIKSVKEKKLPELDDELAQDVSDKYETLADLKKDLKEKLHKAADEKVREDMISQLVEAVVKSSTIPLPKSMVNSELYMRWHKFLQQYRADEALVVKELEKEGKSKEIVLDEWRPKVEEGIRSALVVEKMIDEEKIEVTDEDVAGEFERIAEYQNTTPEMIKEYYEKQKQIDNLKMMLSRQKLFDLLLSQSEIKKGKKIKYLDLMKENY
ncbi:MAG: trigger factor [Spirochaetales bacterium]|nr:trigger factor [Spirochaetales bacterium]